MDDQGTNRERGVKPERYVRLRQHEGGSAAYVELYDHPHQIVSGIVANTIELDEIIFATGGHTDPRIFLDFNADGRLIGIEILDWGSGREK